MNELNVKFENCFGIKYLKYDFDFTLSNAYCIYAPNVTMKTSFTKTFKCLAENIEPKDLINTEIKSTCDVKDEIGKKIDGRDLLIVESYRDDFKVDKVSTLLASEKLKNKYDTIYSNLEGKKDILLSQLAKLCGIRKKQEVMEEILQCWHKKEREFYECIKEVIDNKEQFIYK